MSIFTHTSLAAFQSLLNVHGWHFPNASFNKHLAGAQCFHWMKYLSSFNLKSDFILLLSINERENSEEMGS